MFLINVSCQRFPFGSSATQHQHWLNIYRTKNWIWSIKNFLRRADWHSRGFAIGLLWILQSGNSTSFGRHSSIAPALQCDCFSHSRKFGRSNYPSIPLLTRRKIRELLGICEYQLGFPISPEGIKTSRSRHIHIAPTRLSIASLNQSQDCLSGDWILVGNP